MLVKAALAKRAEAQGSQSWVPVGNRREEVIGDDGGRCGRWSQTLMSLYPAAFI